MRPTWSYNVAAELRGQGIASRALQAFLTWAAQQIGLRRAHLACHIDNLASRRVAEQCGFVLLGQQGKPSTSSGRTSTRRAADLALVTAQYEAQYERRSVSGVAKAADQDGRGGYHMVIDPDHLQRELPTERGANGQAEHIGQIEESTRGRADPGSVAAHQRRMGTRYRSRMRSREPGHRTASAMSFSSRLFSCDREGTVKVGDIESCRSSTASVTRSPAMSC